MIVLLAIFGVVYLQKALVVFGIFANFKKVPTIPDDELPTVSVLIPARNEEHNIEVCLDSLIHLEYPKDKLEIIVGDDQSEDETAFLVEDFMRQHSHIKMIKISLEYHGLVARSNVLAQLAQEASGELMVFLDADMRVTSNWLKNMVYPACQGYDLVSGYTKVAGKNWFTRFQQCDWFGVLALLKAVSDLGLPGTAIGNNMLVSKRAYMAVGGYEAIGATYTEDNDLTLALRKRGYRLFQVVTAQYAITKPLISWKALFAQRNRWMQGAFKQPWFKLLPLIFARTFVLWGILMSILTYEWGLAFIGHIVFIEAITTFLIYLKIGLGNNVFYVLSAPIFNSLLDTFTLFTYPWNRKVVWKGRKL